MTDYHSVAVAAAVPDDAELQQLLLPPLLLAVALGLAD